MPITKTELCCKLILKITNYTRHVVYQLCCMHLIETALCNKLFNILAKLQVNEFSIENLMIMIFHQTEEKGIYIGETKYVFLIVSTTKKGTANSIGNTSKAHA
ncbi:hypothetical protein P5673_009860 [Acropora cervicornis]|uniref:Uncharacterized protein n=1 Tax=Acropora cervicornis TaxID=6130 RepID=A0AAD9VA30_ACRCE|nr:hypothetical protein P5673_009860 [Acropora cervicornis]